MCELEAVNNKFVELLLESEATDEEIETEVESHEQYKCNFLTAKLKIVNRASDISEQAGSQIQPHKEKPFKRPTLHIPKFSGKISDWLQFWSHFKKIHEDVNISNEDKLEYLKQSMEVGSKADNVVGGYPTTAENYEKAFASLKNRFGRDELLVEFYTRELLALVLQNAANKEKRVSVVSIYDKLSAHIRALESLGVTKNNCATMLYPLVESSLPEEILRTWQRSLTSGEAAGEGVAAADRLSKLLEFLEAEVENEERIAMAVKGFAPQTEIEKREKPRGTKTRINSSNEIPTASALFTTEDKRKKCIFCKENHDNAACEKAKRIPIDTRTGLIKENGCCFRCLKRGHLSKDCKVKITCSWCGNRHSTLTCPVLCNNNSGKDGSIDKKQVTDTAETVNEHNLANTCNLPNVYLQTLRIVLYSDSRERTVRAIIDGGSHRSYIRTEVAEYLGYKSIGDVDVAHSLFGGIKTKIQAHNVYRVRARSLNGKYACNFEAMDKLLICDTIPSIKSTAWISELSNRKISLSDLDTNVGSSVEPIDVLIGADIAGKLMTGLKYDLDNGPTVIETYLGWTVMGKTAENKSRDSALTVLSMFSANAKITDLWHLDVLGITDPVEKSNRLMKEEEIKDNFLRTVFRNESNRYVVDLPWIENHAPLSQNLNLAKRRLEDTEKRLRKDELYEDYDKVFREWLEEGIVEIVPENEWSSFAHYLPHRPVIKKESTTKIRPVFDASASEKGFPSLNQCLETGPNLIELIPTSLLRFRQHEIAVIADIRKAFLQIEINPKDRDFVRFLWYVDGEIRIFRHKRVVFGLTCSPFLLGAVLKRHFSSLLREVNEGNHSCWSKEIIEKLEKSFYVDNCTTSVQSLRELDDFIAASKDILKTGGFELRGWEYTHDGTAKENTLVLGIVFNKTRDTLSINPEKLDCKEKKGECVTKRSILSMAHKIFDPIGFTCPVTLLPKLLLKKLHKLRIQWDDPVDENTQREFKRWCNQLHYLARIEIPRTLGGGDLSIHTFCDASKSAYAAVTFLRIDRGNDTELRLLAAKARVAPDNASIPRLELLAASIGSRQTHEIKKALSYEGVPTLYWSDSTTVIAWLDRDVQWGVFVWNRVREIRQLTSSGTWRYVPGELNPADLPSRGCQAKQLFDSRWWEGPDWLRGTQKDWPVLSGTIDEDEVNFELRKSAQTSLLTVKKEVDFSIVEKFSSYSKMIRFFVIMLRFKYYILRREKPVCTRITYQEICQAERKHLKYLQEQMFVHSDNPKLATLQTRIDSDGLIRLKTKIFERDDKFSFLCPIILDKSKTVELIIRETHENMCHAGVQTVMCQIREKFWIISMRRIVRSVISKCVICKRHNSKNLNADSPPLPVHRVKDATAFEIIGVDFAGPVFLRGRQRAWICLFTCAIYRAVHIELVTSLSTKTFLDSLRRFIARKGRPSIVYSDNGTNFVGADNAFKRLNWDVISSYSSAKRIDWRFNPQTAAWWGGWWERLIGLLKNILRRVLGRACLTYEEMITVLCDCETTLNSRPLTYISEEPSDLKTLTPAMFLNGLKETETPEIDIIDRVNLHDRFKRKLELMQHLRKRFRKEYLSQLILKRNVKELREVREGDVVLIGDDNKKRTDWVLARIQSLIAGKDGINRVAVLKTRDGFLRRPIQRLYPLEINQNSENEFLRKRINENARAEIDFESKNVNENKRLATEFQRQKSDSRKMDSPPKIQTRSGRVVKKPDFFLA